MIKRVSLICIGVLSLLLLNLCFSSCKSDDDGDSTSSKQSGVAEIVVNDIETYDFSTIDYTQLLELKNYPYEVQFKVPVEEGETWEATLTFDESDIPEGEEYYYELGSLGKASGTGPGKFSLYVYENQNNARHSATISVFSSRATVAKAISLIQYPAAINADDEKILPSNAKRRMIGYGYDYTAGYKAEECAKNQVLNVAQLCGEGVTINYGDGLGSETYKMEFTNFRNEVDYNEICGLNTAEIELKLEGSVAASIDVCSFSAEIENQTGWENKSETKYQYGWADISVSKYRAHMDINRDNLYRPEMLMKSAYVAINGLSRSYASDYKDPKTGKTGFYNLIKDYGSYVVVGGNLGGFANVTMQVEDTDISGAFASEAMLKLAYDGIFTGRSEVDASYKTTYRSYKSNFKFRSTVRGGDDESSNAFTSLLTNMDASTSERNNVSSAWKDTLSDVNNCVFLGYSSKDQLIPIYEFVDLDEEGGEERRAALEEYFATKMLEDFPETESQESYIKQAPAKITIPDFPSLETRVYPITIFGVPIYITEEEIHSLIKDIKLTDGVMAVRACSEYIPELDDTNRVTVLYPADNARVYWNRGLYLGNSKQAPCSISWVDGKPVKTSIYCEKNAKGEYITPTTVYRFGKSLSIFTPTYLSSDLKIVEAGVAEEYFEKLGDKSYAMVKIGDCIFMREYWDYGNFNDGTSIADVAKGEANWRNHADQNNIPIRDWVQTVAGQTVNTSKNDHRISGNGVYYPMSMYRKHINDHGGLFPSGWGLPRKSWMMKLVARLDKVTNKTAMGGNIAQAFLNHDILGLRIYKYGYISFWNGNGSSCWYQEDYDKYAAFPVIFDDYGKLDYETTGHGAVRLVITDNTVSIVAHQIKCSRADEQQKTEFDNNFVSDRGPCFTVLLCKSIY